MFDGPSEAVAVEKTHDECARQRFIVSFKQALRFGLQPEIAKRFETQIKPGLDAAKGAPLDDLSREDRRQAKQAIGQLDLYRYWQAMTYWSQGFMWDWTEDVLSHNLERVQATFDQLMADGPKFGSLELDPAFEIPAYIKKTEIHRQTGGFAFENGRDDITAGMRYNTGSSIYSKGNNRGGSLPGDWLIDQVLDIHPGLKPKRILDIGCGVGINTTAYARRFPDAEVIAVDVAPGMLRYGHLNAEDQGLAIHFKQMNAAELAFEDGSFDLVVSHIVGHETSTRDLPRFLAEAWRVVKPGGAVLHMDVPTQPGYTDLAGQVMNDWQVRYNGEAFWMGWADANVRDMMSAAGVPDDCQVAEHRGRTGVAGHWFVHGATKPADWAAAQPKAA